MKVVIVFLARLKRKGVTAALKIVDSIFGTHFEWTHRFKINQYHSSDYRFSNDQISFVHLPKTGGTSCYKQLAMDKKERFINLQIHRPIAEHCPPGEFKYLTIMRNPTDRVWSLYQMILRHPKGYPYRQYAVQGLHCFLDNCWEARNMACRYYTAKIKEEPTKQTLELAKENIKHFYAILSFDDFSNEVGRFLKVHDIPFENVLHERKSKNASPTALDISLIEKYNQADIQLYQAWQTSLIN